MNPDHTDQTLVILLRFSFIGSILVLHLLARRAVIWISFDDQILIFRDTLGRRLGQIDQGQIYESIVIIRKNDAAFQGPQFSERNFLMKLLGQVIRFFIAVVFRSVPRQTGTEDFIMLAIHSKNGHASKSILLPNTYAWNMRTYARLEAWMKDRFLPVERDPNLIWMDSSVTKAGYFLLLVAATTLSLLGWAASCLANDGVVVFNGNEFVQENVVLGVRLVGKFCILARDHCGRV